MPEPEQLDAMRTELAALREEVERLRRELAELREYIGEVPCMECGITSFEEWQKDH
jgi:prefoldin subunit 5